MIGNYPKKILNKIDRSGNIWKSAIINYMILNIIYFYHNLIENRRELSLFEETITDQIFLFSYYFITIILASILLRLLKIKCSIAVFSQYLLATSILFSIVYIIDIPMLLSNYNFDIFLGLIELILYIWISWVFIKYFVEGKKKYFAFLGIMCVFYITTVIRAIILAIPI